LYALIRRTCFLLTKDSKSKEDFLHILKQFIKNHLRSDFNKQIFIYSIEKFEEMAWEDIKKECGEVPRAVADEDEETFLWLAKLEAAQMVA
jgi:hypothetical protein